jgi:glycosyltransferase involved in cell wall biosynthesis
MPRAKATSAPLRVLMLSWEYPPRIVGGIARHVYDLSRALARLGHQIHVVTPAHADAPAEERRRTPEGGAVIVHRVPADPIHPVDFLTSIHQLNFALCQGALPAVSREGFDLIHAHDWVSCFAARTLKHGCGLPLVATIHATEHGRHHGIHNDLQHYIHTVEWLLTYEAWRVICCSQYMTGEVERIFSLPPDKLEAVPNGVEISRLALPAAARREQATFRAQWAAPDEQIVFYVGRIVPEKGLDVLLSAAPAVLAKAPATRFVLAGGGDTTGLRELARRMGVESRVRFAGFISDEALVQLYAAADAAVFPSRYEPFGIVALEAMAARVPVVVSDAGGLIEVVRDGETGLVARAGDPVSLAAALVKALRDPALASGLRRRGYASARDEFNWRGIALRTVDIYQRVLGEAHRTRKEKRRT